MLRRVQSAVQCFKSRSDNPASDNSDGTKPGSKHDTAAWVLSLAVLAPAATLDQAVVATLLWPTLSVHVIRQRFTLLAKKGVCRASSPALPTLVAEFLASATDPETRTQLHCDVLSQVQAAAAAVDQSWAPEAACRAAGYVLDHAVRQHALPAGQAALSCRMTVLTLPWILACVRRDPYLAGLAADVRALLHAVSTSDAPDDPADALAWLCAVLAAWVPPQPRTSRLARSIEHALLRHLAISFDDVSVPLHSRALMQLRAQVYTQRRKLLKRRRKSSDSSTGSHDAQRAVVMALDASVRVSSSAIACAVARDVSPGGRHVIVTVDEAGNLSSHRNAPGRANTRTQVSTRRSTRYVEAAVSDVATITVPGPRVLVLVAKGGVVEVHDLSARKHRSPSVLYKTHHVITALVTFTTPNGTPCVLVAFRSQTAVHLQPIMIFELVTRTCIATLAMLPLRVHCADIHVDQSAGDAHLIAIGGQDGIVMVVDPFSGANRAKDIRIRTDHKAILSVSIASLTWGGHPPQPCVVSGSWKDELTLHAVRSGQLLLRVALPPNVLVPVRRLLLHPPFLIMHRGISEEPEDTVFVLRFVPESREARIAQLPIWCRAPEALTFDPVESQLVVLRSSSAGTQTAQFLRCQDLDYL